MTRSPKVPTERDYIKDLLGKRSKVKYISIEFSVFLSRVDKCHPDSHNGLRGRKKPVPTNVSTPV